MDNRPASEYAQSGSHFPYTPSAAPHSELPAADQTSAAAPAPYTSTPQPEVRPNPQYTPQPDVRPAANISSSNTPQSDYGLSQPPAARSPAYPEYLARPPQYHHAPNTQPGGAAGMAQATSPSMTNDHRNHSNVKSDAGVPIDPSIAASSPTYPPPYSPYQPQGHEMAQYQGHPPPPPPQMYARPEWSHGYGQHQHGLPGPYTTPATTVGPASPAVTAGPRPGQVYSFVPIPGAQQHKRPRRRYEEIERMYKCGWNGCEKAYGTLNHLNAHVTMQSHGAKRTPEEFKEIRKEWKARKKEEEAQRKAAEERERAAAAQAAQANQVDAPAAGDPAQAAQPPAYPGGVRPQLPPIGYQPADGQVPGQYGAPGAGGMVYQGNGQMAYPPNYPHSPYGQSGQVYQQPPSSPVSSAARSLLFRPVGAKCWSSSDSSPSVDLADATSPNEPADADIDPLLGVAMAGTSPKVRDRGVDAAFSGRSVSAKVVELELKWLKDPRALADRVARLLGGGDVPLAAALVRSAQKERMECAVAWNHLMEYCMGKRAPRAAFKFYNDMKKRGRKPTSRTYTIMLNGLSKAGRNSGLDPVKTAYSIYRSISAANSVVEPNIIHGNAMLNVCWRMGDMDTLWRVAGELPEDGPGSPDSTTYTIILKAIRDATQKDVESMQPRDVRPVLERKAQGVVEGKRVWSDIVYQWGKGRLALDNQLVGAMGALLLEGSSDRDCYDVFALINQTTGVPILAKEPPKSTPKSSATSRSQEDSIHRQEELEDVPFVDEANRLYRPESDQEAIEEYEEEEENFDNLFDAVIPTDAGKSRIGGEEPAPSYLPVGNRELSMIMEACLTMTQSLGTGKAYWNYLTREDNEHRIDPDSGSFHQYLRLLRLGRSSRATVDVIREQMVPSGVMEGRTFHIALSCCRRDRNNINVLKNANELLKLMDEHVVLPDPKALEGYLELIRVLEDNPHLLVSLNGLDMDKKRSSSSLGSLGRELQFRLRQLAIGQLRPLVAKLDKAMQHGAGARLSGGNRKPKKSEDCPAHAIRGSQALKVLVQARGLIDTTLKPENASLLSKTLREQLEKESVELRKYSDAEVMKKYKGLMISPTPDQILAFEDRARG
ncbi:hypothetical protein BDV59DRAFT_208504 [Aspergillus ambiguus]|uniref:uncharacterized protein n=1 Tax=Aspergillus ambiguus TaxID=176160 RepID=UPI003CCD1A95